MLPTQKEIEIPLLEALIELGGKGRPNDIYPLVTKRFPAITDDDLAWTLKTGGNRWTNRIQFTRRSLKVKGEIGESPRGIWAITDKGRKRVEPRPGESFSNKELEILATAYETLVGRTHVFDVLSAKKWGATGIQNWVQTELIVALIDRGFDVTTRGKIKRDCDIIVKDNSGLDLGVELKTGTSGGYKFLLQGIAGHPGADLFLLVTRLDKNTISGLEQYFSNDKFTHKQKMLRPGWMLIIAKKIK